MTSSKKAKSKKKKLSKKAKLEFERRSKASKKGWKKRKAPKPVVKKKKVVRAKPKPVAAKKTTKKELERQARHERNLKIREKNLKIREKNLRIRAKKVERQQEELRKAKFEFELDYWTPDIESGYIKRDGLVSPNYSRLRYQVETEELKANIMRITGTELGVAVHQLSKSARRNLDRLLKQISKQYGVSLREAYTFYFSP